MKLRWTAWKIGAAAAIAAGLALAGGWIWRVGELRRAVVAALPAVPDLAGGSAELKSRLDDAERRARSGWRPVEALRELTRLYHANGFYAEAMQAYAKLLEVDATDPRWPHLQAGLLSGYGRLDEALPLLRRAMTLAPDYLPAHVRLGDALLKINRPAEAAQIYQAVLARDPDNLYAQLGLARLDMDAERWDAARDRLQRLVTAHPGFGSAWFLLATVDENRGDQAQAKADRERVGLNGRFREMPDPWTDELMEDCYDVYRLRVVAGAAAGAGETDTARRWLERALVLAPTDATAERQLGNLLAKADQLAEARRHLERAAALAPADADNWNYLIALLNTLGDDRAAEQALVTGLANCPQSPGLHFERGRRLAAAGRVGEAVVELQTARRLRPEAANAYVELAMLDFRRGLIDEGVAEMRGALAVEPGQPLALVALARYEIDQGDAAASLDLIRRVRQQPKVKPDDVNGLERAYREKFGRLPW
jgi:tetratricopeptide (TPR) repeat protein